MRYSDIIAFLVSKYRFFWLGVILLATALCAIRIITYKNYDSDILNLLPANDSAVQGLKVYHRDFNQSRELAFLIEADDPQDLEAFKSYFIEALQKQPWVVRFLDGLPLETPAGLQSYPSFLVSLVLNLPEPEFRQALQLIDPAALNKRLVQLMELARAGSPRAELELRFDPTGIATIAAAPLFKTIALDDTFALVSPDGCSQVISIITNQPSLDVATCQLQMDSVSSFLKNTLANYPGIAPEIYVTGRSAYVAQIAASMQRDIMITSSASLLLICLLFYLAYRTILPLFGITVILLFSAFAALAIGTYIFPSINLIAVAFCSLLFGLGSDFGLLLFNHLKSHFSNSCEDIASTIRAKAYSITSVTTTTALGFSALAFSESSGFTQLGFLTFIGVIICGIAMPSFLFVFLTNKALEGKAPRTGIFTDILSKWNKMISILAKAPANKPASKLEFWKSRTTFLWIPFGVFALFGFCKLPTLPFNTSAQALEPQDAPAAIALRRMMETFPGAFEPVIIQVSATTATEAANRARLLDTYLEQLYAKDAIAGFSGASALVPDPIRLETNWRILRDTDLQPAIDTLAHVEQRYAIQLTTAQELLHLLRSSEEETKRKPEKNEEIATDRFSSPILLFSSLLPEASPWWFIVDRFVTTHANSFVAFVKPAPTTPLPIQEIQQKIPNARVTGFSIMLESLKSWAYSELRLFGYGVGGIILAMLAIIYRSIKAWFLHVLALLISLGCILATIDLANVTINILNVLAAPLILGVGIDYSTHLILASTHRNCSLNELFSVVKPVILSAMTTLAGFGALMLASNPALRGLGVICFIGIGWMVLTAFALVFPICMRLTPKQKVTAPEMSNAT